MPSFPPPGEVTICEINRELIVADSLSDARSKDAYGDVLGMVFSPVPIYSELAPASIELTAEEEPPERIHRRGLAGLKTTITKSFKQLLFPASNANLLHEVDTQRISWHPHKHCLAFVSISSQVIIRDYEEPGCEEPSILTSEVQRNVKALEWRPNSGKMIAIGCKGGICLWSASYPGNTASVRRGITSSLGTLSRGSGLRWVLVDFLQSPNDEQISTLSWKPDGRYLASASCDSWSFTIWDVAQGIGTPIRRGVSTISLLKWSPIGDYFFSAKFDGTFYLWETNTWTSEPWSSTRGNVSSAAWDPEGRIVVISFSESTTLGSVHFSSKPPSLDANLLPVELPEISALVGSQGIEKLAWDASGERLALSFKGGDEKYHGLVAIYDVKRTPLISASLVGFIRGPGDRAEPLAFAFNNKFKQGPLLSVCWSSGWCCTYPLLLRTPRLP